MKVFTRSMWTHSGRSLTRWLHLVVGIPAMFKRGERISLCPSKLIVHATERALIFKNQRQTNVYRFSLEG